MKTKHILILLFLVVCNILYAQESFFTSDKWTDYIEQVAEDAEDTERIEALYIELSYLIDNPLNINEANREELLKIPFLTEAQADSIIAYRQRYAPLLSHFELKNIPSLDFHTISLLLPFIYVPDKPVDKLPVSVDNLLKRGRNELQIRYDRGFQQKTGYRTQPDSILEKYPNRRYLGEPFYHSIRYTYTFDRRIQAGIVAEKDAGEPFWNNHHKGYDYYSFHYFQKGRGALKNLALGDYKMSFGQGLVVSNDFMPGRNTMVTQAERRTYGFRRHYSTNEADYFRGAAATFRHKHYELSLFYSYRKMDASVDSFTFTTLKTDGLHRTAGDWKKRQTIPLHTYGGNIRYATPDLCLGFTLLSYSFTHFEMQPEPQPYNLFYFRGNNHWNGSIDYLWKNRYIKFYGETAISANRAWATLNALQIKPHSSFVLLFLHRYYDRRYQALYGNAFAQSGNVQNEQGIYMGIELTPLPYWKLSAYADFFRFPWLKYGIDAPSAGKEYMVQADYTSPRAVSFYLRYKYKKKEKNYTGNEIHNIIIPYDQQRLRLQSIYPFLATFRGKTAVDGVWYVENENAHKGFMFSQSVAYKPVKLPLQTDIYIAWFHTDNHQTRISSYERNLLYAFSMPTFYGRGMRLAATFRWDILQQLSLSCKVGYTHYYDREHIGTGLEEIEDRNKTDIYTQLRWKF